MYEHPISLHARVSDKGCSYCVHLTFAFQLFQKLETLSVRQKASLKAGHFLPLLAACTKCVRRQTPPDKPLDFEFLIQAQSHHIQRPVVVKPRMSMFPSHVSLAAEQWALCCKANCNGHMIPAQNQAGHYQWGTISEELHDFSFISGGKGLCPQSSAQLQKARSGTQPSRAGQLGTSGTGNCSG